MAERLTRKAFRAWLAADPLRVFRQDGCWDGHCPLAQFTGRTGDESDWWQRTGWANAFRLQVDEASGFQAGTKTASITARECIALLDKIR